VIVEIALVPTVTAAGEVAANVMSAMVNVAVVECVSVPLVPVTVTAYVPEVVALHDRVAVPEFVMLAGVIAPQVKPDGTVSARLTVPVNPLIAATVNVEDVSVLTVVLGDVADIEKSVTV
jgi:hypothetical protein